MKFDSFEEYLPNMGQQHVVFLEGFSNYGRLYVVDRKTITDISDFVDDTGDDKLHGLPEY